MKVLHHWLVQAEAGYLSGCVPPGLDVLQQLSTSLGLVHMAPHAGMHVVPLMVLLLIQVDLSLLDALVIIAAIGRLEVLSDLVPNFRQR